MNVNSPKIVAILVNPVAGKGKAMALAEKISLALTGKGIHFSEFKSDWPKTLEGFSDAWIVGGDGTLNFFLNCYPNIQLPLVIFKGGTGNDFAWKLYGDIDFEKQLTIALSTESKMVDGGTCNGKYFINGIGIGFDGEVLRSMNAIRLFGGHLGYLLAVVKNIFSFREKQYHIHSESIDIKGKFLLVLLNNSSRTGGGFHVSPSAEINDGQLDLVLAAPLKLLKRLRYLPVIEKGKHLSLPFIQHHRFQQLTITCSEEIPAHIDGELVKATQFEISILKARYLFRY
jgi:diacylglycerol kinase (ATP)